MYTTYTIRRTKNNVAQPEKKSNFASHLIIHRFSPFNRLYNSAVLWLDNGDYPENLQTEFLF